MFERAFRLIENLIRKAYPLGSPQNPEVLEPGEVFPRAKPSRFRFFILLSSLMVFVSLPAGLSLYMVRWLFNVGLESGNILAWIGLFFFAPPAFLLALLAFLIDVTLLGALIAILRGRNSIQVQFWSAQNRSRGNFRDSYRDVTPQSSEVLPPRDEL